MPRRHISLRKQRQVVARAGHCCEYCRILADFAAQSFVIEHITPVSQRGTDNLDNLAFACPGCNGHKSDKIHAHDPESGETVPLFHPRAQVWRDHFRWSDDSRHIIGLTPTGRVTVSALRMNRPKLVNLRSALMAVGVHPPQ